LWTSILISFSFTKTQRQFRSALQRNQRLDFGQFASEITASYRMA
jgi:hypothetical protein